MPKKLTQPHNRKKSLSSTKKEKSFSRDLYMGVMVLVVIFLSSSYFLMFILSNKPSILKVCQQTEEYIQINESGFSTLFSTLFDRASKCPENTENCMAVNRTEVYQLLADQESLENFSSTYFIRSAGKDHIEKLFLSGRYQKDEADTNGEKKVKKVLDAEKSKICAEGIKTDNTFTTMTYLNDFISEAEVVIPVKKGDEVIGAVVRIYGD